jgi:uncharacterized protein
MVRYADDETEKMRKTISLAVFLLCSLILLTLAGGYSLCKPVNQPVPSIVGPRHQRVVLNEVAGKETVAWLSTSESRKGIVLAHGNSANRNSMIPRMEYFSSLGYRVIAPDLNSHGETIGKRKTFGYLESKDIQNAVLLMRNKLGVTWIAGIGTSLGGASMLKAESMDNQFDALIVEAVFSDIQIAARNRLEMKLGKAGGLFEPLLTGQLPIWTGISRECLRPVEWAQKCDVPILILSGSMDKRAMPWESKAIFEKIPNPKKRNIVFEGAAHQDLFEFNSGKYKALVTSFLDEIQQDAHN